jgi:hypothetical protein
MKKCTHQRISAQLLEIINYCKAYCILQGKKMPTTEEITKIIASVTDKEKIAHELIK